MQFLTSFLGYRNSKTLRFANFLFSFFFVSLKKKKVDLKVMTKDFLARGFLGVFEDAIIEGFDMDFIP